MPAQTDKDKSRGTAAASGEKATSTKTGPGADADDSKARAQTGQPTGTRTERRTAYINGEFDEDAVLDAMDERQRAQFDELDDNTRASILRDWDRTGVHVGPAGDLRTANDAQVLLPTDESGGTKGSGAGAEHSEALTPMEKADADAAGGQ
jgi:hypothetical protein